MSAIVGNYRGITKWVFFAAKRLRSTKQIHTDTQKRRLVCVFRFAQFYTNQPSLLSAGDLRRYVQEET